MVSRLLPLLLLFVAGCAGLKAGEARLLLNDVEIHQDTVWQGAVRIDGTVKVFKGATLTILPGTDIAFARRDADGDGLGDGTLIVEGALQAVGSRRQPIRFRSDAPDPRPGDWLEIRIDFSRDTQLRYCEIRDSAHTLHAHFTRGAMEDCTIRNNIDGCRLGESTFVIRNCLIENNLGKGINFRNAAVEITRNIIRHNASGIFLFESDRASSIHHNNLYGNTYNFRLGDFYQGDVQVEENWWGTADPEAAAATVYDRKHDPEIGTVHLRPASAWLSQCGPRETLELREAWNMATDGFVDASPVVADDTVYAGSWDGRVLALTVDGHLQWERQLGDVIDAALVVDERALYLQSWARQVSALDRQDGALRWSFTYPPSPADDHRQGGALRVADLLLLPAWNGTLYALAAADGAVRWQYRGGQPLRAAPALDADRLYLASGAGILSALGLDGRLLWQIDLGTPLLATPVVTPAGPVAVTRDGTVLAFDRDGSERWRRDLGETCYYGAPVYGEGALYLGTAGGTLWKLEADSGRIVWRQEQPGPLYSTPRLAAGRLFFGDNDGRLYAVGAESGDVLATFVVDGEIQGTPALLGGRLFFGARDHHLYALDLVEIAPKQEP